MKYAILEAHLISTFYLKIACAIAATFMLDYAIDCYKILIVEDPIEFLRKVVVNGKAKEDSA